MMEINLLPWRLDLRRQQRKKQGLWAGFILVSLLSVLMVVIALHDYHQTRKGNRMPKHAHSIVGQAQAWIYLDKIKYVGYIRQGKRQYALLRLPSGKIIDVQLGSDIGGGVHVLSLNESKLVLASADNHLVTLKETYATD